MELVVAAEHDATSTILPFAYQSTFTKPLHVKGVFRKWGGTGKEFLHLDLSQAVASLSGNPLNLVEYINIWVVESINESMRTFPSGTLADGTYQRECQSERSFAEGLFILNDIAIQAIMIGVKFEIRLVRPAVKSHFEVNGRGRVISFEAHGVGDVTFDEVQFTFGPGPNR
jgi:hypothetical protein